MRILALLILLLASALTWAADGEVRLLYAGNLAVGDDAQRALVATRLTALADEARVGGMPSLLLLPGNLFSPEPVAAMRDAAALETVVSLSPAAVAIGPNEWKWGPEYLRQRLPQSPLPWVSLNTAPRGVPVASSRIVTAGRLRIGVIGLTLSPGVLPDSTLCTQVRRTVAGLRSRCDLVVLLGTFDMQQAPVLTAMLDDVDVVLGGVGADAPDGYGASVLAPAGANTPYVGMLDCAIRDGRLAAWRGGCEPCLIPDDAEPTE